ncbi:MAG TPA: hypothetical protein VND45_07710 [Thermoanaerobaculia bacterium]|nr:hypothetical protein [Thermoanaerobaculia bacterium]
MDPEFQRALIVVLVAGLVITGIAATVLAFAFRAAKGGRPMHPGLIGGLVAFVFLCCAILFFVAYQ